MAKKRLFDMVIAVAGLIALSPVMLILALTVFASMGRPVFFRQVRAGLHGRDFELIKFRSMRNAAGPDGFPLPDEQRVTRVGHFLRRSRLDELPELLLILGGAMSFVGPRPLPRSSLEVAGVVASRCRVPPGLTGLAQVSGNTLLSDTEKFAIDLLYVERRSLWLDIRIVMATLWTVIAGERRNEALIKEALQCVRF